MKKRLRPSTWARADYPKLYEPRPKPKKVPVTLRLKFSDDFKQWLKETP